LVILLIDQTAETIWSVTSYRVLDRFSYEEDPTLRTYQLISWSVFIVLTLLMTLGLALLIFGTLRTAAPRGTFGDPATGYPGPYGPPNAFGQPPASGPPGPPPAWGQPAAPSYPGAPPPPAHAGSPQPHSPGQYGSAPQPGPWQPAPEPPTAWQPSQGQPGAWQPGQGQSYGGPSPRPEDGAR
jgi:hypothetical protein